MDNNPAYEKTCDILRDAGYQRLDSFRRHLRAPEFASPPEDHFEIWAGRKGTLILQVWNGGNGATTYNNWSMGHTFDELKVAL